ncbi:MAG: T9SS type A sorting domain-containing protein [Bacteroidetes bacterium]|nr:T9SS type A sorting domain-containing protein [Bacteroidota bacterium]
MKKMNKTMNGILAIAMILLTANAFAVPMDGIYTIDPSGSGSKNFTTFTKAIKMLTDSGISGKVIFNIANGKYYESIELFPIKGASKTQTITFQSLSKDSTKVIIQDTIKDFTIHLNGADYITINQLTIINEVNDGAAIWLENYADSNMICNNRILGRKVYWDKYPKSACIRLGNKVIESKSTSSDSSNVISSNIIKYAYTGIFLNANTSVNPYGNIITYNYFDSSDYSIYASYQYGLIVKFNKVISKIGSRGFHFAFCNKNTSHPNSVNIVANNFISLYGAADWGLFSYQSEYTYFFNNNVMIHDSDVTHGENCAAEFYAEKKSPTCKVYNNNFCVYNMKGGEALSIRDSILSDYNNLYSSGSYLTRWQGGAITTFSLWKKYCLCDSHSISIDPKYISIYDLHVKNVGLKGKGIYSSFVPTDIDGDLRNTKSPDIGADEFDTTITKIESLISRNITFNISPNPFTQTTTLSYNLQKQNPVQIQLIDVLGRTISSLANNNQNAGEHSLNFSAPTIGVYFLRIAIGDEVVVKRVVMVR